MIDYSLPTTVTVQGTEYRIRNDGDYRVVLDIISAITDREIPEKEKVTVALRIFYAEDIPCDVLEAWRAVVSFIDLDANAVEQARQKPKLMDWAQDFSLIIPPINKALGFEVRAVPYLHWWTFIGGYQEIGADNTFSYVVRIRSKRLCGEKLDKAEQKFFAENRDIVELKTALTNEEQELLNRLSGGG